MFPKETPLTSSTAGPWSASPGRAGTGCSWSVLARSPLSSVPNEALYPRGMSTVPQALSLDPDHSVIYQQVVRL